MPGRFRADIQKRPCRGVDSKRLDNIGVLERGLGIQGRSRADNQIRLVRK